MSGFPFARDAVGALHAGRCPRVTALAVAAAMALPACHRAPPPTAEVQSEPVASAKATEPPSTTSPTPSSSAAPSNDGPYIAAKVIAATVYKLPEVGSRKLGYIRLGGRVKRDPERVDGNGCRGDFYRVEPMGYVCTDDATIDMNDPLVRAASRGPDLSKPMPYHYGFVRATAPQYLRVPTREEQLKSEIGLEEHLRWYDENRFDVQRVELGANDVPLDARGYAAIGAPLPPGQKVSSQLDMDELLGGAADEPVPWWLDGGRKIPNVAAFSVPEYAVFADRVRRKTGLSLVDAFVAKDGDFERRFAVTVDMRLVPATKIKPDTASMFHGTEVGDRLQMPFAFVNQRGASAWKLIKSEDVAKPTDPIPLRAIVPLSARRGSSRASAFTRRSPTPRAGSAPTISGSCHRRRRGPRRPRRGRSGSTCRSSSRPSCSTKGSGRCTRPW